MRYPREECACFTGHRIVKNDFNPREVERAVEELLGRGIHVFLNGMALGFDTLCFNVLLDMKNRYPEIKIVSCVPCPDQSKKFPFKSKREYLRLLKKADEVILVCPEYTDECMKERDRFMVDNSSVCISYLYKSTGGAYYTTKYAVEKEIEIIYVK
jgi:uncharacterized phage-like protein YoqJ